MRWVACVVLLLVLSVESRAGEVFLIPEYNPKPIHLNEWLKALKCRELNEITVNTPEHAWADTSAFYYTRAYLSNAFSTATLPNERRLALIARMNRKVPIIVRQCLNSPVSRYVRFLPEEIRRLL